MSNETIPPDTTFARPKKAAVTRMGEWRPKFLASLAATGHVTLSADHAGIDDSTAHRHRRKNAAFAAEWKRALRHAGDVLEAEARRRAVEGVTEPVYQGGKHVGDVQKYSDTLLIFLLKGARPRKYRDSIKVEHAGKVKFNPITFDGDDLTADEMLRLNRAFEGQLPPPAKQLD